LARRLIPSTGQRDVPERCDQQYLELATHTLYDFKSLIARHWRLVAPLLDEGREDISDGQEPNDIGDALGAQRIRIAASVEKFVMMPHGIENFRLRRT
jgi:hypothetical protein